MSKTDSSRGKIGAVHSVFLHLPRISAVIYLKYVVRRIGHNKLGLGDASHQSLTAFYEGEWATVGAMTVKLTLPPTAKADSVSIIGLTPALNNADGNLFCYDVHIGVTN